MGKLPPLGPRIDKRVLPFGPPPVKERRPIGERNGLATYTRLNQRNEARLARLRGETDSPHVRWVTTLPCCFCMPEHYYRDGQLVDQIAPFLLDRDPEDPRQVISDPHHCRTRGRGGKLLTCPACRPCHDLLEGINSGHFTVMETTGVDPDAVADLLWRVSPYRED